MFKFDNIIVSYEKINDRSINSNRFWFTPKDESVGFPIEDVKKFVNENIGGADNLHGKRFSNLYHMFMTEAQTNFFLALCPYADIEGYSIKLIGDRLYGHMLSVSKTEAQKKIKEDEPKTEVKEDAVKTEETKEEVKEETKEDAPKTEETKEDAVKTEEIKEDTPETKEETSADNTEEKPTEEPKPKKPAKKTTKK